MIHGSPFAGGCEVEVTIPDRGLLQPLLERLGTSARDVVLHRLVDEAAPLARLRQPVEGVNRGFRQHDVNALCHGGC